MAGSIETPKNRTRRLGRFTGLNKQLEALELTGKPGVKHLRRILKEQVRYMVKATRAQRQGRRFEFDPRRVGLLTQISPEQTKPLTKKPLFGRKKKLTMVGPDGKPLK